MRMAQSDLDILLFIAFANLNGGSRGVISENWALQSNQTVLYYQTSTRTKIRVVTLILAGLYYAPIL